MPTKTSKAKKTTKKRGQNKSAKPQTATAPKLDFTGTESDAIQPNFRKLTAPQSATHTAKNKEAVKGRGAVIAYYAQVKAYLTQGVDSAALLADCEKQPKAKREDAKKMLVAARSDIGQDDRETILESVQGLLEDDSITPKDLFGMDKFQAKAKKKSEIILSLQTAEALQIRFIHALGVEGKTKTSNGLEVDITAHLADVFKAALDAKVSETGMSLWETMLDPNVTIDAKVKAFRDCIHNVKNHLDSKKLKPAMDAAIKKAKANKLTLDAAKLKEAQVATVDAMLEGKHEQVDLSKHETKVWIIQRHDAFKGNAGGQLTSKASKSQLENAIRNCTDYVSLIAGTSVKSKNERKQTNKYNAKLAKETAKK